MANRQIRPSSAGSGHLWLLDWLRFLTALAVCMGHYRAYHWLAFGDLTAASKSHMVYAFFAITRIGHEAVLVFFILSGYFVAGRLLEQVVSGSFDARKYVLDRVTRIYLPLVPALLLTAAVGIVCKGREWESFEFFGNIFAFQGIWVGNFMENGPLWSLSYEIWFYIGAACFAAVMQRKGGAVVLITGGFVALVFTVLIPCYLFVWIFGGMVYLVQKTVAGGKCFLGGLIVLVGALGLLQFTSSQGGWTRFEILVIKPYGFTVSQSHFRTISEFLFSAGVGVCLPFLGRAGNMKGLRSGTQSFVGFLSSAGTKLAGFSYSLYLIHIPIYWVFEYFYPRRGDSVTAESIISYLLKVGLVIVAAWCFACFTEHQTKRLRDFLGTRLLKSKRASC